MNIKKQSSLQKNMLLPLTICWSLFFSLFACIALTKENFVFSNAKAVVTYNKLLPPKKNHPAQKHNTPDILTDSHQKKQPLRAVTEDQSGVWSNAFNFSKTWGTQVDPRTGIFAFHVKVGSLLSNFGHGPDIDLEINYDSSAIADRDGLGHGWSWNLTHFNSLTNQLITSSGQSFFLQQINDGHWIPQYHKLKDLLISGDKNSHFVITYANGLRETLNHEGYETLLEQQDGHSVHFIYTPDTHRLKAITDDENHKITIEQQETYIIVSSYDSIGQNVNVRINHQAGKLYAVTLPLRNNLHGSGIDIYYTNNLITKIIYPTGLKEAFTYNCEDAMKLSLQNDLAGRAICVISGKTMDPGAEQPLMKTYYAYSQISANAHNYLGFNSGLTAANSSKRDILFDAPVNYTYRTLQRNNAIKEIRTYNKYHLLINDRKIDVHTDHILSEVQNFYCRTDKADGCAETSFRHLPITYSFPLKTVTRIWGESDETPVTTTTTAAYDNYGRVISSSDNYGRTTKTVYCPVQGNAACPPVAAGWLLNALPISVTTYPSDKGSKSTLLPVTTYNYYRKLANFRGTGYIPILDHQIHQVGNQQRVITRRYYDDHTNTFTYGLLRKTILTGTQSITDTLKAVTKNYYYFKSRDGYCKTTYNTTVFQSGKFQPSSSVTTSLFTNQVLERSDPEKKNITRYHYDHWGRLVQTDLAVGTAFATHTGYQYTLSPQLNEILMTAANGLQARVVFDSAGRKIAGFREAITTAGKAVPNHWLPAYKISYNSDGYISKKTAFWFDASGNRHSQSSTLDYDYAGRTRHTHLPDGETVFTFYDDTDRCQVSYQKSAQGQYSVISVIRANELDKPAQEVILPVPSQPLPSIKNLCTTAGKQSGVKVTTIAYNGFGRPITMTDSSGKTVHKYYDAWGKVTDVINPAGDRTHTEYNLTDQVIKQQIFPAGGGSYVLSSAGYNAAGQLLWQSGEDGKPTAYTYTPNGHVNTTTLKTGHILSWQYNVLGLPVAQRLDGKALLQTDYDFNTTLPIKKQDNTGTTTYVYSDDGLIQKLIHHGTGSYPDYKLQWTYDNNRRMISVTDISGNKTINKYDTLGRLSAVNYEPRDSHKMVDTLYRPTYDRFSRIIAVQYGSGMHRSFNYDGYGRIHQVNDTLNNTLLSRWNYTYDINDNINTINQLTGKNETGRLNYHYDIRNNLISMTCQGSSSLPLCPRETALSDVGFLREAPVIAKQTYTFTPLNRLAKVREIVYRRDQEGTLIKVTTYTYGNHNSPLRLQAISTRWDNGPRNTSTFVYDKAGNMIKDGEGKKINYNAFNQITRVTTPTGVQSHYAYDGSGKEVMEQSMQGKRYLIYRGGLINEKIISSGMASHVIGYQGIARTIDNVIERYYESNYKGDIVGVLTRDPQNNHQYRLSRRNLYSPYGMEWHKLDESEPSYQQQVLGFDGERTDPATRWQFLGAGHRTYNPQQRYFVSEDQAGDGYLFCGNNPIMSTDPSGNMPKWMETGSRIMGYIGTLGFSAIPKKWARITGVSISLGLTSVAAGLMALSEGISAAAGAVSFNAALTSLPVIAASVPPNKGLNIAAEITGGLAVITIVATGLTELYDAAVFFTIGRQTSASSFGAGIELATMNESAGAAEAETSLMEDNINEQETPALRRPDSIQIAKSQTPRTVDQFVRENSEGITVFRRTNFFRQREELDFYHVLLRTPFAHSASVLNAIPRNALSIPYFFLERDPVMRNIFNAYVTEMYATYEMSLGEDVVINSSEQYTDINAFFLDQKYELREMFRKDIKSFYEGIAAFRQRINYYGPILTKRTSASFVYGVKYNRAFIRFVLEGLPG